MTTYGIGHTDAINSFWYIVEAINRHPRFNIAYPNNHDEQQAIAQGFYEVSTAGVGCCAKAVDGILVWIHKPFPSDYTHSGCCTGKFFCGRKKKFGLNCQAVCDVRGQILDTSIQYPGSTLDCLAFEGMSLFQKLEEGILAPGLCLFGDNAYLITPYMATPYAAVSARTKDSYKQLYSFPIANTNRVHIWHADTSMVHSEECNTNECWGTQKYCCASTGACKAPQLLY
jgi:hypothetical protein